MKNKLILGLIIFTNVLCFSQELPKIIPPSPTVQNFMRYGEIPVDFSTGVPNISIPIYTVKSKKLELPINISYHASGIKVNDIASEVGLGWVLNAGGIVSRTVMGKPDEKAITNKTFNSAQQVVEAVQAAALIPYNISTHCLDGMYNLEYWFSEQNGFENEDSESDRFSYSLPNGISGVFRNDYLNNTIITLPYRPLKIEKIFNVPQPWESFKIIGFKITDENGTIYKFEHSTLLLQDYSEWRLTEIKSSDSTDTIKLEYTNLTEINSIPMESFDFSEKAIRHNTANNCSPNNYESFMHKSIQSVIPLTSILTKIISSDAIVNFNYVNDRSDFNNLPRLSEITIAAVNSPLNIIKRVQFNKKDFGSTVGNKRLGLDNIAISTPGDPKVQSYLFTYENNQELPAYPFKMEIPKYNEDYWGYSNGSNSPSLIPSEYMSNSYDRNYYGGNRKAGDEYFSKACMLKEIKYPTGGRTVFQFERAHLENIYPYENNTYDGAGFIGGFRVQSITNYHKNNEVANIKTYDYAGCVAKQFRKDYFRLYRTFFSEENNGCFVDYSRYTVFSNPILSLDVAPGLPIMYTNVTEYQGTKINNSGKTIYEYNRPYSPSDFEINQEHPVEWEALEYYHTFHYDKGNYVPELISKTEYSFDGTMYNIVSKEENEYTKFYTRKFQTGIKLSRPLHFNISGFFCFWLEFSSSTDIAAAYYYIKNKFIDSFVAIDTKAYQEASLISNTKFYTYDPNDSNKYVLTSTDYTYNPTNLGVTEKSTFSSTNKLLKTTYKYPYDFQAQAPYNTMLSKNILSTLIEQKDYNGTALLNTTKTNYKDWGNNIIEPENIQVHKDNNLPESRIRFLSYDVKGNVVSLKKEDDIPITYLWGYNKSLPIAEVKNCNSVEQNSIQTESIFNSSFYDPMNWGQNYTLGTFTLSGDRIVTFDRGYVKNNDHEATFYISIYKSGYSLPQISDYLSTSQTDLSVSSSFSLPAGNYTIVINAGYGGKSGPFTNEINFNMSSTVEQKINVPFHTSFEEDIQDVNIVYAKTGRKSHIGSYSLKIPPASVGYNQVIVSYWGKINVSSPWVYVENVVNAGSVTDYTIGSSYAYIDEVRMYPLNAQMTTYTYDPLIGVTSITDKKGDTFTYTYDNFGRLQNVKDKDGNILSENEYHYKN